MVQAISGLKFNTRNAGVAAGIGAANSQNWVISAQGAVNAPEAPGVMGETHFPHRSFHF